MADMTLSGSHAAYALGHAANLAPKPRRLDHVGAAAVPVAAATALQMVRDLARRGRLATTDGTVSGNIATGTGGTR